MNTCTIRLQTRSEIHSRCRETWLLHKKSLDKIMLNMLDCRTFSGQINTAHFAHPEPRRVHSFQPLGIEDPNYPILVQSAALLGRQYECDICACARIFHCAQIAPDRIDLLFSKEEE